MDGVMSTVSVVHDTWVEWFGKILVIDDEFIHAERVANALNAAGFEVIGYECHIDDAVQVVVNSAPSVLILDIAFKDSRRAGIDFLRNLRRGAYGRLEINPFVFFLSGVLAEDSTRRMAEEVPGTCILQKPLRNDGLIRAIGNESESVGAWYVEQELKRRLEDGDSWPQQWTAQEALWRAALLQRKHRELLPLSRTQTHLLALLQEKQAILLDRNSIVTLDTVQNVIEEISRIEEDRD
jgi:DNA-binding response OmpR family regulator